MSTRSIASASPADSNVDPTIAPLGDAAPSSTRLGFPAGVGAAVVLLLLVAILRLASGQPSFLEVVSDAILRLLPGATFSTILDALQRSAKPLLYLGIAVGVLLVGGIVGIWYSARPSLQRSSLVVLVPWLIVGGPVFGIAGAGPFGSHLASGALWNGGTLLFLFAAFAGTLAANFKALARREHGRVAPDAARRATLIGGVAAIAAAVAAGTLWRFTQGRAIPAAVQGQMASGRDLAAAGLRPQSVNATPFDLPGISPEITPTKDFYQVSKNFVDPRVDAPGWKLRIDGLVTNPIELTYEQLQALPSREVVHTLMCISNEVGGNLWGSAVWRGIAVRTLLDQAGVRPGAFKAVFSAADNYEDSVKIEHVLNPDAMLVWEMNGAPLEAQHGFPARLLIPGIYGMKNVKWITGIKVVAEDFKGYWQTRGWNDDASYQTASRFDVPGARLTFSAGSVPAAGVAFAGNRGISRVEVSLDGGVTWQPAELKPGLSPNAWQLWRADLLLTPDVKTLQVRSTDGDGHVQTNVKASPFPNGSTGYDTVRIAVS